MGHVTSQMVRDLITSYKREGYTPALEFVTQGNRADELWYSALYRFERRSTEWIDVGGEA